MEETHDKEWVRSYIKTHCKTVDKDGKTYTYYPSTYYWIIRLVIVMAGKVWRLESENIELKRRIEKLEKYVTPD